MSEHQREDDTTPLEYFISGLVVLLFGLMYFFINHGKDFMSGSGDAGALPLAVPVVAATAEPGIANALLADNNTEAEMPSVDGDAADGEDEQEPGAEDEVLAQAERDKQTEEAAEKAEREQADKERMAAEKALRDQLAAERERADEATRKLAQAEKLLAAEKARNAEVAEAPAVEPTPTQQLVQAESDTADETDSEPETEQAIVYKLPDGTEIPVSDEGFEGSAKTAMAKSAEDDVALMNEPILFDDISFESGSAQLSENSQQQIRVLAALMHTHQDKKILIRGHTDNVGGVNANSLLSLTRSDSMKKQLVGLGIDQTRIKIEGVGQLEPLASNDTDEGRSRNRRIELVLIR